MLDFLFGWRKASRCKKLIEHVQCRLKLLKNKKDSIVRLLHEDIVQLHKNGQEQSALVRVEQLSKEENMIAAYDLLDNFCEFIILQLPYIRRHRDCPKDINEAVSSLLFASARCGDLPELYKLRKLFRERYGNKFATASIELLPGNLVNHQIIEKLCKESIPHNVNFRLMKEIIRDDSNSLQLTPKEIDVRFEQQYHQVYDLALGHFEFNWEDQISDREILFTKNGTQRAQLKTSNDIEIQVDGNKREELDLLDEPRTVSNRDYGQSNPESCISSRSCRISSQHKVERITGATSESSSQLFVGSLVYLDDVEEIKPCMKERGRDDDQSLFIFKLGIPLQRNNCIADTVSLSDLNKKGDTEDNTKSCKPSCGKTSSRRRRERRKSGRKRMRRKCVSLENEMQYSSMSLVLSMKDIEYAMYYGEPGDSSPDGDLLSSRSHHCFLKHPHYFLTNDDKDDRGSTSPRQSNGVATLVELPYHNFQQREHDHFYCHSSPDQELVNAIMTTNSRCCSLVAHKDLSNYMKDQDMGWVSTPQIPEEGTDYNKTGAVQSKEVEEDADFPDNNDSSWGSWIKTQAPELPQTLWSASSQFQQPNQSNRSLSSYSTCHHIHPKLPDYDDLVTKFMALKKEHFSK